MAHIKENDYIVVSADWLRACGEEALVGQPLRVRQVKDLGAVMGIAGRVFYTVDLPSGRSWEIWEARGVEKAPAPRTYYTLIEWVPATAGRAAGWCPQFGDYSCRVVEDEWRDSYKGDGSTYRIIDSGDSQRDIQLAIEAEGPPPAAAKGRGLR